MVGSPLSRRTALILPLVFLLVVLLEEVAAYKVRQLTSDVHTQVAASVILHGLGFALVAAKVIPLLRRALVRMRRYTRRDAGLIGLALFYALAYGLIYYAYLILETRGAGGLLPPGLR